MPRPYAMLAAMLGLAACGGPEAPPDEPGPLCSPPETSACQCPDGGTAICNPDGHCGCLDFTFCQTCQAPADCGGGLGCFAAVCKPNAASGGCPGDGCTIDTDCAGAGWQVCQSGQCVPRAAHSGTSLASPQCTTIHGVVFDAVDDSTVVLGSLLPLTGFLGAYGPSMDRAVRLATDEINAAGGIFGRRLAVVSCDSASEGAQGGDVVTHLASADVPAVVGAAASAVTIEAFTSAARPTGTLMISPSSTSPVITTLEDDGLLWRTAPSDIIQGRAMAGHTLAAGYARIALVHAPDPYGAGISDAAQSVLCAAIDCESQLKVIQFEGGPDAGPVVSAVQDFAADVVLVVAFEADGVTLLKELHAAGHSRFVVTDTLKSTALLQALPPAALCGVYGVSSQLAPSATHAGFVSRYQEAFGEPPGPFAAHAYDALYMLAYAVASHGPDASALTGADVAHGLARLSHGPLVNVGGSEWNAAKDLATSGATLDLVGASGPVDMDPETGEPGGCAHGWSVDVTAGEVLELGPLQCGEGPYTDVTAPACQP